MTKFELSKYIISKYNGTVSPMKLQKLLYYAYAWQLVAGEKYFNAQFQAWPYGPVEPDVYHEYKNYGSKAISLDSKNHATINNAVLDFILDSYSVYSPIELSKTTHVEEPWKKNVDSGGVISDNDLLAYYKKQAFAKNFPLSPNKPYIPPKTSSHYAFTFDMETDNTPLFENIDAYVACFNAESNRLDTILKKYELEY